MYRLCCALSVLASQVLALPFAINLVRRDGHRVQFAQETVRVMFRLVDANRDGTLSATETHNFISQPDPGMLPSVLLHRVVTEQEAQDVVESLSEWVRNILAVILIRAETERLIKQGVITVPSTPAEVADKTLDFLDTNGNGKISESEAHAYYNAIGASSAFWETMKELGHEVDEDSDRELNRHELIRCNQLAEQRHGPLVYEPLIVYSRIISLLGEFPNINLK